MGQKILCVGLVLLGLTMVGMAIPSLVVGIVIIIGALGVLVGY